MKPVWKSVKTMPTKRVYSSPVICGDQLYVVGGCDSSGVPLDCFESYHSGRDRWYRLANVPTKRASPCVLQTGGKLVAMGGVSTTQQPLNVVEVYDPSEKEWTHQDVMKDHLMGISGVVRGILHSAVAEFLSELCNNINNNNNNNNILICQCNQWLRCSQSHHIFQPIAVDTSCPINESARAFLDDLGRRISVLSGDVREHLFLFQRISVAIQRFNTILLHDSFPSEDHPD